MAYTVGDDSDCATDSESGSGSDLGCQYGGETALWITTKKPKSTGNTKTSTSQPVRKTTTSKPDRKTTSSKVRGDSDDEYYPTLKTKAITTKRRKFAAALPKGTALTQDGSALMQLPPEVRNRIYAFLFAEKTIHIRYYDKLNYRYQQCDSDADDESHDEAAERSIPIMYGELCKAPHAVHLLDLVGAAHAQKHNLDDSICHGRDSDCATAASLPVQLLRTCKRIHSEAVLIPYAENLFIFDDKDSEYNRYRGRGDLLRRCLVRNFGPLQRRAIRNAAVCNVDRALFGRLPSLLPGLQRLFVEFCDWGEYLNVTVKMDPRAVIRKSDVQHLAALDALIDKFRDMGLVGVAIHIEPALGSSVYAGRLGRLVASMENGVLGG